MANEDDNAREGGGEGDQNSNGAGNGALSVLTMILDMESSLRVGYKMRAIIRSGSAPSQDPRPLRPFRNGRLERGPCPAG